MSLAVLTLAAAVAAPSLEIVVSPREVAVGDLVTATLTVKAPAADLVGAPLFPDWGDTWGDAELRAVGPVETLAEEDGLAVIRQQLTLATFEVGTIELPAIAVEVPTAFEVIEVGPDRPVVLEVRSVLPPDEENPAPKPPAPPVPLPLGSRFWWTAGALGLLSALAAAFLLRRRASTAGVAKVDPLTALTTALARLRGSDSLEEIYAGLSLELRRYLNGALGVTAAESTTTEVRGLLHGAGLPAETQIAVDRLLKACDRVKFAGEAPVRERALDGITEAARIAAEIETFLAPPEEGAEQRQEAA